MAENEIPLVITADTKQAQKSLDSFQKSATSFITGVQGAIIGLTAAIAGLGFAKAIEEASGADDAIQKLNVSLANSGDYSKEASAAFVEFADSVELATGKTSESVLELVSLAKAFGIGNAEAQKMTQAAIDLAAATGVDAETALKQLGGTLTGSVGKLGKLGSEFKNLTVEQLKAGAAIDLINSKFAGTAAGLSGTFSGSLKKAEVAFSNIFEAFGKSVTQNKAVIESLNTLTTVFNDIAKIIDDNREAMATFVKDGLQFVAKGVAILAAVFSGLLDVFDNVASIVSVVLVGAFQLLGYAIQDYVLTPISYLEKGLAAISLGFVTLVRIISETAQAIPGVGSAFGVVGVNLDRVNETLGKLSSGLGDVVTGKTKTFAEALKEGVAEGADAASVKVLELANKSKGMSDQFKRVAEVVGVNALSLSDKIGKIGNVLTDTSKGIKNLNGSKLDDLDAELEKVKGSFDKLKSALESINQENQKLLLSAKEQIDLEKQKGDDLASNAIAELKLLGKLTKENEQIIAQYKEAIDLKRTLAYQEFGGRFVLFTPQFKATLSEYFGAAAQKAIQLFEGIDLKSAATTAIQGLTTALQSTDEKSRFQGIGNVLTGALTAWLGPLGSAIGGFATQLSQMSKEQTREFVAEFVKSAPKFVKAIAENLPELIKGLVDLMKNPSFWVDIVNAWFISVRTLYINMYAEIFRSVGQILGGIFAGAWQGLKVIWDQIFAEFFQGMAETAQQFASGIGIALRDGATSLLSGVREGIREGISSIGDFFRNIFGDAGNQIADAMFEPVNKLIEFFTNFDFGSLVPGGGGGGVGGFVGQVANTVGSALGFANGGIVPIYAAGGAFVPKGSDTVPAMLTPGELVVPKDTTRELQDYLARQDNQQSSETPALLAAILATLNNPISVSSSVEVNQQAFANIILQLNRQNARLTA